MAVVITLSILLLLVQPSVACADDNRIAHRLFRSGNFAEAAEIYTDPHWKGIALYRSDQWWRSAEAFVRADKPESLYNLGNTYVKLGYYALALEAYQAALAKQPDFEDAQFNLDLMRQLLSQNDDQNSETASARRGNEIDRVDSDGDQPGGSEKEQDDRKGEDKENGSDREGGTDNRDPMPETSSEGNSNEAGSDKTLEGTDAPEGGSVKGTETERSSSENAAGDSEGRDSTADSQAAAQRTTLASEQATEQWLNQIKHDPMKYLQKRIELELQRRKASGTTAPQGGSQW